MYDDSQAGLSIVQIDGQWHRLLPHNELDILSAIGGGPGTILVDEHGVAEPIINGRATLIPGKSYKSVDTKDPIRGAQSRRIREHAAQQNIHVELGIDKLEALMPHLHHDTKPQTGGQNELNTPKEVLEYLIKVGVMRANLPIHRAVYAGIMTGLFIGIGSLLSISAGGGLNSAYVKETFPGLPRLIQGATFPIALMLVIGYGGELFTGNTMYCLLALLRGKIKLWQLARNWFLSFFSNLAGCLFFAYFLGYLTDLYVSEPYLGFVRGIGEKKVSIGFGVSFLRGVGANACVCLAVFISLVSRDWTGRLIAMWWPIFTFVAIGYEHSVANMFFGPLAIFYGGKLTTAEFITNCLIPSTLGNIVGGGFLIGASAYFLYPSPPSAPGAPLSSDQTKNDTIALKNIPASVDKAYVKSSDKGILKGEKGVNFVLPSLPAFLSSDRFSQDIQLTTKMSNRDRPSSDREGVMKSNPNYYNYNQYTNNEFFSDVDGGLMIYYERYRNKNGKQISVIVEGNLMVEDGRPTAMLAVVYPCTHNNNNNNTTNNTTTTTTTTTTNTTTNNNNTNTNNKACSPMITTIVEENHGTAGHGEDHHDDNDNNNNNMDNDNDHGSASSAAAHTSTPHGHHHPHHHHHHHNASDYQIINVHNDDDPTEEKILLNDQKRSSIIINEQQNTANNSNSNSNSNSKTDHKNAITSSNNSSNSTGDGNGTTTTNDDNNANNANANGNGGVSCHHCIVHEHRNGKGSIEFRGIVVMRLSDDRIIRCDDNFCELVGYNRRELLNMTLPQITYPDDIKIMRENIQNKINKFSKRVGGFVR